MAHLIAGGEKYEVGELSLGEFRLLKRRFNVERMDLLDPRDPDHLVGLLVVAELRADPTLKVDDLIEKHEQHSEIDFEGETDEAGEQVPLGPSSRGSETSGSGDGSDSSS